ncbi:MAG TPA: histidine kinase [Blastocatellia bacterium]|nr:histidine kinase [Blastocatellia bacterium]
MRRISTFQLLLILAMGALIVYLVSAISLYLRLNEPENVSENITELAPFWVFWAIHAPLILILSRRFAFDRTRLIKSLLIYLSVGTVWAMLVQGLPLLLLPILKDLTSYNIEQFYRPDHDWVFILFLNMLIYWVILSNSLIFLYYERYQNEMLKASKLDVQLSNARLQALKMQLHPHFLFNTLHSITALVLKNENRDAVKMINRLSELLRLTLDNIETQVLTLEDEIEFTRRYLEIERIRFHDRLAVEWDIDPKALIAQVPNLILQPLVENAMRHAVDSNSGTSRIQIVARLQNDQVLMEVRDDGKDLKKISGQNGAAGLGLKTTRERLSELYGEDYSFSLSRRENEWTIAQIVIPFLPAKEQSKGELN